MLKKGFTLLEVIMVIIVLGIIASIGADIIVQLYNNYMRTRTIDRLENQANITLEQIAQRLQYRIKSSVIARQPSGIISDVESADSSYSVVEWIGYSNESFLGTPRPGWSGFIDLDDPDTNSTSQTLKTTDSNLSFASDIISAMTYTDIDLTDGNEAAIIFKGKPYNYQDFGWGNPNNSDGNATVKVEQAGTNLDILQISSDDNISGEDIYEQYYLAHSAYALVPSDVNSTDFNLTLRYNYQPWLGQDYDNNGSVAVLAENVSLFRMAKWKSVLRMKLCLHDANLTGVGERIVTCREKVVY